MFSDAPMKITPVLDPVERASETILGVLTTLTFTGSLSVVAVGGGQVRTMMIAAPCSNLAGGLTDAVMYLIGTGTERHRQVALQHPVDHATDQVLAACSNTRLKSR